LKSSLSLDTRRRRYVILVAKDGNEKNERTPSLLLRILRATFQNTDCATAMSSRRSSSGGSDDDDDGGDGGGGGGGGGHGRKHTPACV
jgi:hypothetical protein